MFVSTVGEGEGSALTGNLFVHRIDCCIFPNSYIFQLQLRRAVPCLNRISCPFRISTTLNFM